MILASAEGLTNAAVARRVGVTPHTVSKWRRRFREAGIQGLHDELRPGRPRTYDDDKVAAVINRALQETPDAATHWSTRTLGRAEGIGKSTVQRWCALFGVKPVKPHLARPSSCPPIRSSSRKCATSSGCTSTRRTTRWCCAWMKSRRFRRSIARSRRCRWAWATSRATPGLQPTTTSGTARRRCSPLSPPGGCWRSAGSGTATRSSCRSCGWSTGRCRRSWTSTSCWTTTRRTSTPRSRRWLATRPRFHLHFTPTYSSWLNQVERWFGLLSQRAIKRGSFRSVPDLVSKIQAFIDSYNASATPFAWVATAQSIIDKVARIATRISGTAH